MIATRFVAADFARYEALRGRRTIGISCRVMLLCKQMKEKEKNWDIDNYAVIYVVSFSVVKLITKDE